MANRQPNTKRNGHEFDLGVKLLVWDKATKIPNRPLDDRRYDVCNFLIDLAEYGNRDSQYGWEIDHIDPVNNGGDDDLENLQPLQWNNNASKGDSLNWQCPLPPLWQVLA